MGLGLTQYIPLIIYITSFIIAFLSLFINPTLGVLFLFPLLPYQIIFEKIKLWTFGKDINDIIIISILFGVFLKNNNTSKKNNAIRTKTSLYLPIIVLCITSLISFINATLTSGLGFDLNNNYLLDWKNYMLLPLIWFLTFKNIKDLKNLKLLLFLLIMGILGADYYFSINLKWMNMWHFSERVRNMMDGLFVYLGANHYGAFFAHFIFILIGIFLFEKSKYWKLILLGIIFFTGYCLVYSYSRGAYIALIAGLVFIGLVKEKRILLLLLVFFMFWRNLVPISVYERITMTKTESGELEESAAIRIVLWNKALEMFKESPIIGKGFNTFQFTFNNRLWLDTHNYYLKMLVEQGILGLSAFLYLLFSAFNAGWKLFKESDENTLKGLGLGFASCIIAVALTNAFGDRWTYLSLGSYLWIFMGLVTRAQLIIKPSKQKQE